MPLLFCVHTRTVPDRVKHDVGKNVVVLGNSLPYETSARHVFCCDNDRDDQVAGSDQPAGGCRESLKQPQGLRYRVTDSTLKCRDTDRGFQVAEPIGQVGKAIVGGATMRRQLGLHCFEQFLEVRYTVSFLRANSELDAPQTLRYRLGLSGVNLVAHALRQRGAFSALP